jgi:dihydrofolate reductase
VTVSSVVVSQFVTLDGVFQDPGGIGELEHGGWAFKFDRGPEGNQFKLDEIMAAGALLLGRVTYEGFAQAWPSMKDDAGFAEKMNSMPKYVVSTTLERAEWNNTTVIRGSLPGEVGKLKQRIDGDILVNGSGQLVRTLMELDLVDEFRLMVSPIVLGEGRRLFADSSTPTVLRLTDMTKTGDCLILTYRPAGACASSTGA